MNWLPSEKVVAFNYSFLIRKGARVIDSKIHKKSSTGSDERQVGQIKNMSMDLMLRIQLSS